MLQGRCGEERRPFYYIKACVRCALVHWYTWPQAIRHRIPRINIYWHYRLGHQAPEDVLPCFQESLQYLQLDYLDLYLIHSPFAIRKTANFPNLTEEDKLYYTAEATSKAWAVSTYFSAVYVER